MQAPTIAMGRQYAARPYAQEEPEQKEITTEQIQVRFVALALAEA